MLFDYVNVFPENKELMSSDSIGIISYSSLSALGGDASSILHSYQSCNSTIEKTAIGDNVIPVSKLHTSAEERILELKKSDERYSKIDRTALIGAAIGRKILDAQKIARPIAINIGSSRGATSLFEEYFTRFHESPQRKIPPLTSPTTTLGNISSIVAQELSAEIAFSHSITCSSASFAIANGVAWLKAGMAETALVGGVEAALTPFTAAQMQALGIYSQYNEAPHCRPFELSSNKRNSFVLGEGGALFTLEKVRTASSTPLAIIDAIGFSVEHTVKGATISEQGLALQASMEMALASFERNTIDLIIPHAPGTILGDQAEFIAIQHVFGKKIPNISSNKWLIGHCLGASGALSLEYALLCLHGLTPLPFPYKTPFQPEFRPVKRVLINTAGFGGNAATIIVSRV